MFRKALSFGGMFLVAGAAVLVTPGSGLAQRHGGGGHASGGHFSGGHFGGYHGGGYRGGAGYGGHPYGQYGYRNYYPHHDSNGYHPYFYGGYPYSYSTYPYLSTYDPGYSGTYGDVMPTAPDASTGGTPPAGGYQYRAFYPPTTLSATQPDTKAHVTVNVPAGARLWFEGTATTSTGPVREFNSTALTPGKRYIYEVRARWSENGHEVTQTQEVEVAAGAHVNVNFPVPPKTAGQVSAVKKR